MYIVMPLVYDQCVCVCVCVCVCALVCIKLITVTCMSLHCVHTYNVYTGSFNFEGFFPTTYMCTVSLNRLLSKGIQTPCIVIYTCVSSPVHLQSNVGVLWFK